MNRNKKIMKHSVCYVVVALLFAFAVSPVVAAAQTIDNSTVVTNNATFITSSAATLNGNITSTGGGSNTVRGFQYGLDTNYGSDKHTIGSYGTGAFFVNIRGLLPNTTYHFRAYSTNSAGTSYGADSIFLTTVQYNNSGTTPEQRQRIHEYRQQSDLQQKIAALPSTANASVLMPVLFGVGVKDISPNFGDPRDNGTRTHQGEDIMAVKGTPIVSSTPAVVIRTDYGAGEGNAVYTANPGGETFVYYHLDRFGEGVVSGLVLKQGSLIGYVGNAGNASGGPAHLHFEIHNSSGTPVDPFPRLTGEFSIQEKISYLFTILLQASDSVTLSRFLVTNFRGTFSAALAANIALPMSIIDALASMPATSTSTSTGSSLPAGDLNIGSSGAEVVTLQKYLIQAASGIAATRLADAGATGYFGVITKAALLEYQVAVGISPSDGYYGPTTRAFIAAHPFIGEGALIRAIGDIDVYVVKYINGKKFKRLILSPTVFNSYKDLHWKDIMDVAPEIVDTFITSDLVRATIVGDPKVYKLYPNGDTGEKHWIKTAEAFIRLGYDWDAIYTINETDRNSYIEKEVIE